MYLKLVQNIPYLLITGPSERYLVSMFATSVNFNLMNFLLASNLLAVTLFATVRIRKILS